MGCQIPLSTREALKALPEGPEQRKLWKSHLGQGSPHHKERTKQKCEEVIYFFSPLPTSLRVLEHRREGGWWGTGIGPIRHSCHKAGHRGGSRAQLGLTCCAVSALLAPCLGTWNYFPPGEESGKKKL